MALEVEYVVCSSLFTRGVGEIGQIGITASGPGNDGAKSNGPMVAASALDLCSVVPSGVAEDVLVGGPVENGNVWASTTTPSHRQRIIRLLLERVVVNIQGSTDHVDVTLHWAGGFTSQHGLVRPVLRYDQMADYDQLLARIEQLRGQGLSFAKIAERLNREGFRPAKQVKKFHSDIVSRIVRQRKKVPPGPKAKALLGILGENEWFAIDLASHLGMPKNTLFAWIKRDWVCVVRQLPGYRGRMICWADAEELDRLHRLRQTKHGWWDPPLPKDLTTPKLPPKG